MTLSPRLLSFPALLITLLALASPAGAQAASSQSFASTAAGQTSSATVTLVSDSGFASLTPVIGTDYTVGATTCTPVPGQIDDENCTATVTFAPKYPGLRSDTIQALDDDGFPVASILVYGTGLAPQLAFDFGVGATYSPTITSPEGVAVGPDGRFYVSSGTQVYQFNKDGSGQTSLGFTGLSTPGAVAVDGSSRVYVADPGNNAVYYMGPRATTAVTVIGLDNPIGLAVDGAGSLYIANAGDGGTGSGSVIKIDSSGTQSNIVSEVSDLVGIATDAAGDVYYAQGGSTNTVSEELVAGGTPVVIGQSDFGTIQGIALDAGGRVYIAASGGLVAISPNTVSRYGTGFNGPLAIAVDPQGNIYAAYSSDTGGSVTILLRNTGALSAGAQVGQSGSASLTIQNSGNSPLSFTAFTYSNSVFQTNPDGTDCMVGTPLAAGRTCQLNVLFSPTSPQTYAATLTVTSNSLNSGTSSNAYTLTGNTPQSSTSFTVSPNPSTAGQAVTFTAIVAASFYNGSSFVDVAPTGKVDFVYDEITIGSANLAAKSDGTYQAVLTTSALTQGSYSVRAIYEGSTTVGASNSDVTTVVVNPAANQTPTTASLSVAPTTPAPSGSPETIIVTIAGGTTPAETGTVQFLDGGTQIGQLVTVTPTSTGSMAALAFTGMSTGAHQFSAHYSGDSNYGASTTAVTTYNVPQGSTATALAVSAASIAPGASETLTATVTYAGGAPLFAAGDTVTFSDQTGVLATVPVVGVAPGRYTAATNLTTLASGTHEITAHFDGEANYLTSMSAEQTVTVTGGGSTTTLALSSTSVAYRTALTLTAMVTLPVGASFSSGQVIFCDAAASMCSSASNLGIAQLVNGTTAILRIVPGTIGTHSYKAVFLGTAGTPGSTSANQTVSVTGTYPSSSTITSSGAVGNYSLTGTVVGLGTRTVGPTGTVSFTDTTNTSAPAIGTAALGAAALGFSAAQPSGATPPAVGRNPYGVATGDFNGDGFADVVTENYGAGTVSVLLGNGDGTFRPAVTYSVQVEPERVLTADFNGDGNLDLVVANTGSSSVSVLYGNGDGTFKDQVTFSVASPVGLGVMDLNHDGYPDIVVGDYYNGTISVLLGDGEGFSDAVTYPTGSTPQTLTEGDFDGDGNIDIAVGNEGAGTVGIFLGNGDGTFKAQVTYAAGRGPQGISVGDFNADGKLDLAIANHEDATISVLLGKGDGTFQPQVTYAVGNQPVGVAVADFNGDGIPDLSTGNTAQTDLTQSILLGNGDGTFQTQLVYKTGNFPYGEGVADFNGDGYPDLAIADFSDSTATILLSQVTETATATVTGVAITGSAGTHNVDLSFPGDSNFIASVSPTIPLTEGGRVLVASTTRLAIAPAAASAGQSVAFAVAVAGNTQSTPAPTGSVTLTSTNASLGSTTIVLDGTGSGAFSTSQIPVGTYVVTAVYGGDSVYSASTSAPQTLVVSLATQTITFSPIPNHAIGDAPFTLAATASSGLAVSYTLVSGPATVSGNTVTLTGTTGTVVIRASQAGNATYSAAPSVTQSFTVSNVPPPTLSSISPATVAAGSPATTILLVGTNFTANDVVQINGTAAMSTAFGTSTSLSAVLPASVFATAGVAQITVFDTVGKTTSGASALTIQSEPSIVFSGPTAPPVSGQQPSLTFQLTNPYPVTLSGSLTLAFAPNAAVKTDDPAVQFSAGGRVIDFTIPANSTATPNVALQTGTVAGTITVTLSVSDPNGLNVTPASVTPVVLTIPAAAPTLTSVALERSGDTLNVIVSGFSNTREASKATFHFVAASGSTIDTPDVTADVSALFSGWYSSSASDLYGSTVVYTQTFNLNHDASAVGSVTVTLTNSIGTSSTSSAQ